MTEITPFEQVEQFHQVFDNKRPPIPTALPLAQATKRATFKIEELVEWLFAAAQNDRVGFEEALFCLKQAIDQAEQKVSQKPAAASDTLVDQVDALLDLLYFTYGTFSLLGVDPTKLFDIVHEANMGKLFPDGKPRYDRQTHKVQKPEDWYEKYAPEPRLKAEIARQIAACKND